MDSSVCDSILIRILSSNDVYTNLVTSIMVNG